MREFLWRVKESFLASGFFRRFIRPFIGVWYPAFCLVSIGGIFTILCLVITHIRTSMGLPGIGIFNSWSLKFLSIFGIDASNQQTYNLLISDLIVIVAFSTAVFPGFQIWKNSYRYRKGTGLKVMKVWKPGVDDLQIMHKNFINAEHLTIFCGSFDWLGTNTNLEQLVKGLGSQGKLALISNKTEDFVRNAFALKNRTDLFSDLKPSFRFESGLDIKCTMIRCSGTSNKFLFRSSHEDGRYNASILSKSRQQDDLLYILDRLTNPEKWGNRARV